MLYSSFLFFIAENALPRSYDDILMQSAFDSYASLDNNESKGTKRKLDSETIDEHIGAEQTDDGSPSKRRRFVNRYMTKSNFKQIGRFVGTAIVAVGFYQLTHYLPESFQLYLN